MLPVVHVGDSKFASVDSALGASQILKAVMVVKIHLNRDGKGRKDDFKEGFNQA